MATYGSARNDTPSSARSAASSIGGKGGTSGSSSTGARSGAGGAGGVRGGGKSESAGSKSTSAAAGAASSVGGKSSATSGPGGAGGVRNTSTGTRASETSSNAADRAAAASRGLLGSDRGGSILSNPSVVSGLLGGSAKMGTQYGPGSEIGANRYGQALNIRGGLVSDWARAGQLDQKIATDQALVGYALDQARRGLLGPMYSSVPATVSKRPNGLSFRSVAKPGTMLDPFNAGIVTHWTNGLSPESNYQVNIDTAGTPTFTQKITPAGMQVTNHAAGLNKSNIGVASLGMAPNPDQLAAAGNFGSFFSGINPNAQITSHGYMAGTLAKERGVPGAYSKMPNEGVALANAIAGQPTTRGGFTPDRAPALSDAVQVASAPKMQDRIAAELDPRSQSLPQQKPSDLASAVAARNVLAGLGVNPARSFAGIPSPSPGYSNPARSFAGIPAPSFPAIGGPEPVTEAQLRNPASGMSFNPGLPGQMAGPDRSRSPGIDGAPMTASDPRSMGPDMARTDTPTSAWNGDVLGPINPQPLSAGMSFNPGMPRNPIGGMAFNPGLPRNPISGMAFNPGLPGAMPNDPRSRSPFVSGEPQIAANDMARRQVAGLPDTPAQGIPNQPGLEAKTPQTGSLFAGLGQALKSAIPDTAVQKAKQSIETIKEALPYSRWVVPPGPNSPAVGGGEGRPLRGNGEGDQQLPTQWTGRESESQVAAMAKNVEEVLRGYFVQIPGQQYPQYTTGPA